MILYICRRRPAGGARTRTAGHNRKVAADMRYLTLHRWVGDPDELCGRESFIARGYRTYDAIPWDVHQQPGIEAVWT
jgi:hypothetical protein